MEEETDFKTTAYVGLGANLGDPVSQLVRARNSILRGPMVIGGRASAIYISSPVGNLEQADFANCVMELEVFGPYRPFFAFLQQLETKLGRVRDPNNQNAARTIDIDLLLFGRQKINEPDLIVPHPRMQQRLFVLLPLQELNPELAREHTTQQDRDFAGQTLHRLAL